MKEIDYEKLKKVLSLVDKYRQIKGRGLITSSSLNIAHKVYDLKQRRGGVTVGGLAISFNLSSRNSTSKRSLRRFGRLVVDG